MTSIRNIFDRISPAALGGLVLVSLGFAMSRTHGTYSREFLALVIIPGTLFIFSPPYPKLSLLHLTDTLPLVMLVFFLFRLWSHTSMEYAIANRVEPWVSILIGLSLILVVLFFFLRNLVFLFLAFSFLSVFLVLVPYFSPDPHIDVFTVTKSAIHYFLNGTNPYLAQYHDKWSEPFGYQPGFSYPPAPLILGVLFYKLFGDFRFLYSMCLILSATLLPLYRKQLNLSTVQAWVLACLWIAFPINPLIIEQAWVDPLLIVSAFGLAIALTSNHIRFAAILMGIHLATKQYAIITFLFSSLWLYSKKGPRDTFRFILFSLFVCLLICIPFLVSGPAGFLKMIGLDVLAIAPRYDAFTLFALFMNEFGIRLPDWLTPLVLISSLGFFGLAWKRNLPQLSDWAFSLFATTLLVFLFSRRAFANYYHFSAGFLIIYLATLFGEKNESYS